ncbi:MAG: hypothetical protein B6I38_11655 [Anaerolineaceae bacterium 4572_5.1]|nr:MAG: hypothetical protein B6I38_11655 [Anaerolineaceae bacterium 4572_5.1]
MSSQSFRLIFPKHLLNEPVINTLMREYNFTLNILRANITSDEGWMDIKITGPTSTIESAVSWLKDQDIEILIISR